MVPCGCPYSWTSQWDEFWESWDVQMTSCVCDGHSGHLVTGSKTEDSLAQQNSVIKKLKCPITVSNDGMTAVKVGVSMTVG